MNEIPLRCVHCREEVLLEQHDGFLQCPHCSQQYPLMAGGLPILVLSPNQYLASLFAQYHTYLEEQEEEISLWRGEAVNDPLLANKLGNYQRAAAWNNKEIEGLMGEMENYFTRRELLEAVQRPAVGYSSRHDYLKRDWCWLNEGERELETIHTILDGILEGCDIKDKALFLGAGLGRVAVDLAYRFERTVLMDYSLAMGYRFQRLQQEDLVFYDVRKKNTKHNGDTLRLLKASFASPLSGNNAFKENEDKIDYFIGDARHSPFPDRSFQLLCSLYFTDVVPIDELLPEIKRLLAPGGYFLHFGPLEYHFKDSTKMYTANELQLLLQKAGFELVHESFVATAHIASEESMLSKTYDNLVLCMKLKEVEELELGLDTVIALADTYSVQTTYPKRHNGHRATAQTSITFFNGEVYEGASSVADILQEIDGARSIEEVMDSVCQSYALSETDKMGIFELIKDLTQKDIIQIVQ